MIRTDCLCSVEESFIKDKYRDLKRKDMELLSINLKGLYIRASGSITFRMAKVL
jgi:hypothetical protein